jgi:molybdopterin/thiamine biosynthesis adenylyltransferase
MTAQTSLFSYEEFTSRNIGFVSYEQQNDLAQACIFIPGVGGMGGSALESLARMGVQKFIIADEDTFEISNLNRQVFCTLDSVGQLKTEATKAKLLKINPQIQVEIYDRAWVQHLDTILPKVDFVLNGCDDIKATIFLMRFAAKHKKTVIDAFASTLPSVYVVRPQDPRPEKFLRFTSPGKSWEQIDAQVENECRVRELEYVLSSSSSSKHVIWKYAKEVVSGKRKRFSLSPMVTTTGNLMAYEALKLILKMPTKVSYRGVFFNPWSLDVEKPSVLLPFRRWLVRFAMRKLN